MEGEEEEKTTSHALTTKRPCLRRTRLLHDSIMNIPSSLLAVVGTLSLLCVSASASDAPEGKLLIVNATIVSPERAAPLEHGSIKIGNGRIEEVGEWHPGMSHSGYALHDASGKYVIPGLIDAHVHLAVIPGMNDAMAEGPSLEKRALAKKLAAKYAQQLPHSYLFYGYTTLIDLNAFDREFIRSLQQAPIHPDIFDCDGAAMFANGYPMLFAPPEKRFESNRNFLYDPRQKDTIPARYRPNEHAPIAVAGRIKGAKGVCMKTFHEDGFGPSRGWPVPTTAMLRDVVAAGRHVGLTTVIHANSFRSQEAATNAGFDIIAHGMWTWDRHSSAHTPPRAIRRLLDRIIDAKTGYMPTYQVLGGLRNLYDPEFLTLPHLNDVLPANMLSWIQSQEGRWFADSLLEEEHLDEEQMLMTFREPIHHLDAVVKYLADRNALFLFGTDTPSSPTFGNPPGLNGFLEMREWNRAGVPLRNILRAATIDNAKAFGLDADYGTVEEGKVANLVILGQDPLASVEAYDAIDTVVVRGRLLPRRTLSATQ